MPARRLAARWLLPVTSPAIEHGALLIGPDGRIEAVGPDAAVPHPAEAEAERFDDAILLPGLINTHTHLELTGLAEGPPAADFPGWIRRLRQRKAERSWDEVLAAARRGVAQCWAAGVTTVADTGDSGAVIQALSAAGGSGIVYQEVFGPHPSSCTESLRGLQRQVETSARFAGGRVRVGVSPHAPYTVSGPLYAATARWATEQGLPIAVHLAESSDETALLSRGEGGFAEAWRARGIPVPSPLGDSPVEWLNRHGVLGDRTLCIHLVQVTPGDIDVLARTNAAVAHCPISNRAHGHGDAPLRALLDARLRVGMGTDSVVSVERLDLLAEARAAAALAGLTADEALALGTSGAARALGLATEVGSLEAGHWGDCVVIRPPAATAGLAPAARVLATGPCDVVATFVGGNAVHRAERTV
jgi:5-methylthioadenosine/S-adenosylhomocysteine deaminase